MEKKSKKVLTIGPDYRTIHGGIVAVISTYSKYYKGFKFLPTYSSENNILNIINFPIKLFKILFFLLANTNYDIVHIHGSGKISTYRKYIIFLVIKYITRKKIIYHIHGSEYHLFYENARGIKKKIIKHFIEESDGVICLSKQWEDFFINNFNIKNIFILNNIVPFPEEHEKSVKETTTFLFLGGFWERKGVFDLLKAFSMCDKSILKKVKLKIGGEGDIEKLNALISQYDLKENIEFLGWITGDEKIKLLKNSDVYVLPSHNEGLPISILEAMSYKLPILTTDVGGIPEVVTNHENGIVVKPGDIESIKKAIEYFTVHPQKSIDYGQVSFDRVKKFLPDYVMEKLEEIYKLIRN